MKVKNHAADLKNQNNAIDQSRYIPMILLTKKIIFAIELIETWFIVLGATSTCAHHPTRRCRWLAPSPRIRS